MKKVKNRKEISPILEKMNVGDSEIYPISRYNSVRNAASLTGLLKNREFSTSISREDGIITVTRIA